MRFPPRSLCGSEDCVCRRSRGVESHLNRRYLISATPHWRIRLLLLYALYDRYKFHDRDPYLYRDPCSCVLNKYNFQFPERGGSGFL